MQADTSGAATANGADAAGHPPPAGTAVTPSAAAARLEPLALHTAVVDVLLRRGASWRPRLKGLPDRIARVTVSADPALLESLLEAAFTWAGEMGETMMVKLETAVWPPCGVLTVRGAGGGQEPAEDREKQADSPSWQSLVQTAAALRVVVRRRITPAYAELTLEFTSTLPGAMGLSTLDSERDGGDAWRVGGNAPGASRAYVAVITTDARAQRHVRAACKPLGMDVQAFARVQDAEYAIRQAAPAVLIIDGELHDEAFDRLRQRLLDEGRAVRTIEIADTQSGFEVSSWELDSSSRIDRDLLEFQLGPVLSLELGR